jgi:signal transduction histidine kinase/ActR/RegA family two-component response regulator
MTPLRRRLFLLSAASIVPLAIFAAFGLRALGVQQRAEIQRIGIEMSQSIANAVDAEARVFIAALETLATASTLQRGSWDAFGGRMRLVLAVHPGWLGLVLSEPDGTPLVHTRSDTGAQAWSVLDPDSFRRAVETQRPSIGSLVRDPEGRWFFPVRVPIMSDRRVRYVLSAMVSPAVIRDVLVRQRAPKDWVISIVDRSNRRIARSRAHDENVGGPLSASAQEVVSSGEGQGFGVSLSLEGERIYTPYTRLDNGWAAVLGLPTAQADAAMRRAISIYAGGVALSVALGLLLAATIGRTITGPIGELGKAAAALGRRQHAMPVRTGIREVHEVGVALTAAADELQRGDAERERLLDRERVARQAAEAADRAKDEFLGVLSHELRTPLNAVFGWGRMLQTGQLRDEEAAARARDAIVRNARVQLQMIDDLLDLSRITSGKMRLEVRPLDLHEVISSAIEAIRPAADAKQIVVATDVQHPVPAMTGDPGRLQQVTWNLLMNAVKFTPVGGRIDVAVARADSQVQVIVRDTGEGIAPEVLPHVFERFRQGDSSSTRPHGGLGLGLALVKHLTEMHGGRVEAASPGQGHGATFTVTLPIRVDTVGRGLEEPDTSDNVANVDARLTRLDSIRIVVVDDDAESLQLAVTVLTAAGADVTCGVSADEGLSLVRELRPDVLISDVEMPGENGYSLIGRVRALGIERGASTPAIALTAYGRPHDRARAIAAGYNLHITKPVDPASLTAFVKTLHEQGVGTVPEQGNPGRPVNHDASGVTGGTWEGCGRETTEG